MAEENDKKDRSIVAVLLGFIKADLIFSMFCLVAFLFVVYFWFTYGITMFFWILLIFWLVFILFYYFKWVVLTINIYLIIFGVLVIFSGLVVLDKVPGVSVSSAGGRTKKLVDCTGTASSPLSKVAGWNTHMYAASPTGTSSTPTFAAKTALKNSYSFADLKNFDKVDNVYYYIELANHSDLPSDYKRIMEVCDSNNKVVAGGSTHDTKMTNSGTKVVASYDWLLPYYINDAAVPGDFRVDGYLYVNGKWTLTDRISSVHIVK